MNNFKNDNSHISTVFLLRLIRGRALTIKHLIEVTHIGTNALHIVALLPDDSYVCDCCMGMNLGLPCRHYLLNMKTDGVPARTGIRNDGMTGTETGVCSEV
jgi:hypothetical protein